MRGSKICKRNYSPLLVVVIIAVAAVAAIELSSKPASSAEARNIKIGLVAPMSHLNWTGHA